MLGHRLQGDQNRAKDFALSSKPGLLDQGNVRENPQIDLQAKRTWAVFLSFGMLASFPTSGRMPLLVPVRPESARGARQG